MRLCRMLRLAESLPYCLDSDNLGVLSLFSVYSMVFFNDLVGFTSAPSALSVVQIGCVYPFTAPKVKAEMK